MQGPLGSTDAESTRRRRYTKASPGLYCVFGGNVLPLILLLTFALCCIFFLTVGYEIQS